MKLYLYAFLTVLVFLTTGVSSTYALTVSPVRVEVSGDPGQTLRGEIELLNEQSEQKTFFSSFENFEPAGDTGAPRFTGAQNGLATWLATESSVSLAPADRKVVPYTITIPKDVEAGGYFAAIFFGEQDPALAEAGTLSIGGKLGVLILLRVNGDVEENAGLSDFSTTDNKKLFSSTPITFSYKFNNQGGDRVAPLGDIVISNVFGGVTETLKANPSDGNVLPNSSRRFTVLWGEQLDAKLTFVQSLRHQISNFHFGWYTASISVVYGATNQEAKDSFGFMVIPWQLLSVVTAFFIVLFFCLKRYNAWIIARSRR
jgi:hypothetical protein